MSRKIIRRLTPSVSVSLDLLSLHPLLKRVYLHRGIQSKEAVDHAFDYLFSWEKLSHIRAAAALLATAILEDKKILIIGDYDVDGVTSTVLAFRLLKAFGAKHVQYFIPNRFDDGYGLTPAVIDGLAKPLPDLIMTVDNGMTCVEGVDAANRLGINVLITDHHLPNAVLPNAAAIVNPNYPGDQFESKYLAGVGVVFYVMMALRAWLREKNYFTSQNLSEPSLAQYLDLVALGTMSDVVPLDHNNRILVQQGLQRIRRGQCCPGIQALLHVAKRPLSSVTSVDLVYAVAPRLNAAGRLDDMILGLECLLSDDLQTASYAALKLEALNQERRQIEKNMHIEALEILQRHQNITTGEWPFGVCLCDAKWHPGIVGILASRIKEKIHRPVIVFSELNEKELKGSARSVTGVHIRNVLENIAKSHPSMILRFGGHEMAAGITIARDQYAEFQKNFAEEIRCMINGKLLCDEVLSDGELSPEDFSVELAKLLRFAQPWGSGFPEPLFDGRFKILHQQLLNNRHLKLTLRAGEFTSPIEGMVFNVNIDQWPNYRCEWVHIAYRLDINDYHHREKLRLMIEHLEAA